MLLHKNKHSGSYIEIQYCRLDADDMKKLVSADSISHWQEDSLFVADENMFYNEYSHVFTDGIYNNLDSGTVDLYGINYYSADVLKTVIHRIRTQKPLEYEILLDWLLAAEGYNGIYILGL